MKWIVEAETLEDMLNDNYSIAVLLTECKDCKHRPDEAWFGCPMASSGKWQLDGFCSFAERKTDGDSV